MRGIVSVGRRIEHTLELLNWILVGCILTGFLVLAAMFAGAFTWASAIVGMVGFDAPNGTFQFVPSGTDFFLIRALVEYSGAGGVGNITLSNWARDKGYGMGSRVGYISSSWRSSTRRSSRSRRGPSRETALGRSSTRCVA